VELLLLERGAANAGPRLSHDVLFMMRLCLSIQADIVKAVMIVRVLPRTEEKAEQVISVFARNKQKAVPVSVFLALIVIDVVNHR
jgi:hypothetical protein